MIDASPGETNLDVVVNRRNLSPQVIISKKLRGSLAPLHRLIGGWQTRATFITARLHGRHADESALHTEAETLLDDVRAGKAMLQDIVERLPEAAASSHLFDTRAALDRIETGMQRILYTRNGKPS